MKKLPRVEKKQVVDIGEDLKLKLQVKGFYSNQLKDFFFKPFSADTQVSIKTLRDIFETNGIPEKKCLILARYIIEPSKDKEVVFSEDASMS